MAVAWDRACIDSAPDGGSVPEGSVFCEAVEDNMQRCWPRTPAGQRSTLLCSDVISQEMAKLGQPAVTELNISSEAVAFRECDVTGNWTNGDWTNYTLCMDPLQALYTPEEPQPSRVMLTYITFFGSLASLAFLSVAMFIFCYFRCLHCSRLSVHKNLMVALMLCNSLLIVISEPFITRRGGGTYRQVDWLCKAVLSLQNVRAASFRPLDVNEGFFLHSRITVSIFDSRAPFKLLHFVGWGIWSVTVFRCAGGLVTGWAVATNLRLPKDCWSGYADLPAIWLLITPMIAALGVNLLFLCNVVRILVTRMKNNTTMEMEKIRKAIKAAAILFPLLGITNLFFFIRTSDKSSGYQIYLITNSLLHSAQGIFVSVLYCFLNSEVRVAIRKKYYRFMTTHASGRWTRKSSCRTSTMMVSQAERLCCRTQRWRSSCKDCQPSGLDSAGGWKLESPPPGTMRSHHRETQI